MHNRTCIRLFQNKDIAKFKKNKLSKLQVFFTTLVLYYLQVQPDRPEQTPSLNQSSELEPSRTRTFLNCNCTHPTGNRTLTQSVHNFRTPKIGPSYIGCFCKKCITVVKGIEDRLDFLNNLQHSSIQAYFYKFLEMIKQNSLFSKFFQNYRRSR